MMAKENDEAIRIDAGRHLTALYRAAGEEDHIGKGMYQAQISIVAFCIERDREMRSAGESRKEVSNDDRRTTSG